MLKRLLLLFAGLLVLGLGVTVFGGSLVWWMLGASDRLEINGTAQAVAPPDPQATTEWPAYGGDAGGSRYSAAAAANPAATRAAQRRDSNELEMSPLCGRSRMVSENTK